MQKIELLQTIFTRCGATCGPASDDTLEIIISINDSENHIMGGVIDVNASLVDIAYELDEVFDVDFYIEEYGKKVYQEHISYFSPISISDNLELEAESLAKSAMKNAYNKYYKFAHEIEKSLAYAAILLQSND